VALNKQQLRKLTIDRIIRRCCALAAVVMVVLLAACGGSNETKDATSNSPDQTASVAPQSNTTDSDTHADNQTFLEFTDSNTDIWPPQPTGITNIATIEQFITNAADPVKNLQRKEQTQKTILAEAQIQSLIGKNYAWLSDQHVTNKAGNEKYKQLQIFSYDNNTLVTVSVDEAANRIIDYQLTAAGAYQPPESRDEASKAIALATQALRGQGFTEHEQLTGTALLAHPSATEIAQSGHTFYEERKLYVTFGPGNGELPHYRATVNLSRSVVEESGAIE